MGRGSLGQTVYVPFKRYLLSELFENLNTYSAKFVRKSSSREFRFLRFRESGGVFYLSAEGLCIVVVCGCVSP